MGDAMRPTFSITDFTTAALHDMKYITSLTKFILAVAFFVAAIAGVHAQPTKQWNQGDPTGKEQYALEFLNHIRADPVGYTEILLKQTATNPLLAGVIASPSQNARDPITNATKLGVTALRIRVQNAVNTFNSDEAKNGSPIPGIPRPPLSLYPMFMEQAARVGVDFLSGKSK